MCIEYGNLEVIDDCTPNASGIKLVSYIQRKNIITEPAEAVSPTTIDQNGQLVGSFTLVATKFWKKLPLESEKSEYSADANGTRGGGNFSQVAMVNLAQSTEKAIGTTNQLKYDDNVFVVETMAGRRFVIGLGKSSKVTVKPAYKSQNTESSDAAGHDIEISAKAAKNYFLDDAVTLAYS